MAVAHSSPAPRWRFWLPWVSALVLVAGIVTFLIVYNVGGIRNTSHQYKTKLSATPAAQPKKLGPHVPLPKSAKLTAARWIKGAVGRDDLADAWKMTAPELKQGISYAQWKSGAIPVVPYPIARSVGGIVRVNWSTPKNVSFEVTFVPKKGVNTGVKAQDFYINLRAVGSGPHRRWLVYYWMPRGAPAVPDANVTR